MEMKQRGFMRTFVARSFDSSLLLFLLLLEGNVFLVELFLILLGCLETRVTIGQHRREGQYTLRGFALPPCLPDMVCAELLAAR